MAEKIVALPPLTLPGILFSYSNESACLIGRVIEVITGQPFEEAVKMLVFDPLGMTMSFFLTADVITRRFVVGHHIEDDVPKVAPWQIPRAAHPAGGLISTVKDLLRYARFHVGDGRTVAGTRLLASELLTLMHTPQVSTGHGTNACGLTWWLREVDGQRISWHPGETNGQVATLYIIPDCDFAVTILTNADTGWTLIEDVTKQAFRQYLAGLELEEPPPQPLDRSEGLLATYTGRYVSPMSEVEVGLSEGELIMRLAFYGGFPTKDFPTPPPQPPAPLTFYEDDHAFIQKGPMAGVRCEFLRDADGHIAWFRIYNRIHVRQQE
jgi:hypothetical protein